MVMPGHYLFFAGLWVKLQGLRLLGTPAKTHPKAWLQHLGYNGTGTIARCPRLENVGSFRFMNICDVVTMFSPTLDENCAAQRRT